MSMAEKSGFVAACVQMRSGVDEAKNIAAMQEQVREAAAEGAHYIQTPEMTGLVQRDRKALLASISPDSDNRVFAAAAALAQDHQIWLHIGSNAVALPNGAVANRAALFSPSGERVAFYDKIHMFDVDLDNGERWRESAIYTPGNKTAIVFTPLAAIGLSICYDLRFPALYREHARIGAQLLTCPSCFTRQTGSAHWHVLLRARAIENGAYMIAAAQGGKHEDGRETFGHSMIVDPWGVILAELEHDEPGIILHEIDPGQVRITRSRIPVLQNERRFEVEQIDALTGAGAKRRAIGDMVQ
jgi:deaminated glutathione amidase